MLNNTLDLTDTTIKLVAELDNERAKLFETLINSKPVYTLLGGINSKFDIDNAYYHILFDFSTFTSNKESLITTLAHLHDKDIVTILDLSDENLFLNKETSSLISVAAIVAGHITCSNSDMQELIYEYTGRLATIVDFPLFKEDFKKPLVVPRKSAKDLNILWYGLNSEIFTIKPYTTQTQFDIDVFIESKSGRNEKLFKTKLQRADIIFLPKTYTEEDEYERVNKTEESIKEGKFVVAPVLQTNTICMDCDLSEAVNLYLKHPSKVEKIIIENQKSLKRLYSPDISADQLALALRLAPHDEFAKSLDFPIEGI